jgi:hypothetical protein
LRPSLLALLLVGSLLLTGCSRFGPACALSIAAIPSGFGAVAGQRLPSDSVILASPADFNPKKAAWGRGADGAVTVSVQMQPEAIARTASYSADHVGEPLAIAIDKTIFTITEITAEIPDGAVTIVPTTVDQAARLPKLFEGCVSTPLLPSPTPPRASG